MADVNKEDIACRPKLFCCPSCGLVSVQFVNINSEKSDMLGSHCANCAERTILLRKSDWQTIAIKHLLDEIME